MYLVWVCFCACVCVCVFLCECVCLCGRYLFEAVEKCVRDRECVYVWLFPLLEKNLLFSWLKQFPTPCYPTSSLYWCVGTHRHTQHTAKLCSIEKIKSVVLGIINSGEVGADTISAPPPPPDNLFCTVWASCWAAACLPLAPQLASQPCKLPSWFWQVQGHACDHDPGAPRAARLHAKYVCVYKLYMYIVYMYMYIYIFILVGRVWLW